MIANSVFYSSMPPFCLWPVRLFNGVQQRPGRSEARSEVALAVAFAYVTTKANRNHTGLSSDVGKSNCMDKKPSMAPSDSTKNVVEREAAGDLFVGAFLGGACIKKALR